MNRWQDIRQLAEIIEAESEGRLVDRDMAVALARQLAKHHPQICQSLNLIVRRMQVETPEEPCP